MTRPVQSVLMPYAKREPGSHTNGLWNEVSSPLTGIGTPVTSP